MIGFKTIDDFTFDECVDFLNQNNSSNKLWSEISLRHSELLRQYQQKDNEWFSTCKTYADYEKFIARFSNLNGASKYVSSNIEKAKEQMSKLQDPHQPRIKKKFGFLTKNASLRHPITNLVLYLLLIGSLVGMFLLIPLLIWSYQLMTEDNWSFIDAYGKGFFPGWLMCVVTCIGILNLIRWKKFGLSILIIGYILVCAPLMCNDFFEFICFSTPILFGCIVLWGIMRLKKDGLSAWFCCIDTPKALHYAQYSFIALWLFTVIALPFIAAFSVGFNKNLYSNGIDVLDANLNSSPYYSIELYKSILMGNDFPYDLSLRKEKSRYYIEQAESLEKEEDLKNYYDWELSAPVLFLNSLIGVYKTEGESKAKEYIKLHEDIDFRHIKAILNGDRNFYFWGPDEYQKPVSSEILNLIEQMEVN